MVKYDGETFKTYGEKEGLFSFNSGRGLRVTGNGDLICVGSYGAGISLFDGNSFFSLLKFEDFLSYPKEKTMQLCAFLEIPFN